MTVVGRLACGTLLTHWADSQALQYVLWVTAIYAYRHINHCELACVQLL